MRWHAIQACVVGRGHERDGSFCEDWAEVREAGELVAVALADGCGSARLGGMGARIAVRAALDSLKGAGSERDLLGATRESVATAAAAVHALAAEFLQEIHHCSSTLMLVVARSDEVVTASIGDGAIVGRRDGNWEVLAGPMGGEFANETVVLTDPNVLTLARIERHTGVTACALLTDGAATSILQRATGRIAPALQKICSAFDVAESDDVERALRDQLCRQLRARTLDDCGIALMVRRDDEANQSALARRPSSVSVARTTQRTPACDKRASSPTDSTRAAPLSVTAVRKPRPIRA